MGKRDFQLFVLLCIAGLSAAVAWVSLRDQQPTDRRVTELTRRAVLESRLDTTAKGLAAQSAGLDRLNRAGPAAARCMKRVTGECRALLDPASGN